MGVKPPPGMWATTHARQFAQAPQFVWLQAFRQASSKHKLLLAPNSNHAKYNHKQHSHADRVPLHTSHHSSHSILYSMQTPRFCVLKSSSDRSVSHNPWNTSRAASACTIAKSTAVGTVDRNTDYHTHMFILQSAAANSAFQVAALLIGQARFHSFANREEDPGFSSSVDELC